MLDKLQSLEPPNLNPHATVSGFLMLPLWFHSEDVCRTREDLPLCITIVKGRSKGIRIELELH